MSAIIAVYAYSVCTASQQLDLCSPDMGSSSRKKGSNSEKDEGKQLYVLGIRECRWTDCWTNIESTGEVIVYSGRRDNQHDERVAIILSKTAAKSLVEYHHVNERIIRVGLKTKPVQTSIIQVYAPTNEAENDIKEEFYEALQAEFQKAPKQELTIIMGDLNAKAGSDNVGYERVMGRNGCGSMNENGEYFTEFCGNNTWSLVEYCSSIRRYTNSQKCHLDGEIKTKSTTSLSMKNGNDLCRIIKERLREQYSNCNKDVTKATKKDRNSFIAGIAREPKKNASEQRMGDLYQITKKKLSERKRKTNMPVKDKQGNLITSEREQEDRWREHFEEVLNRQEPNELAHIPEADTDSEIETEEPSKAEIFKAITALKNNKAPGNDQLPAELFKADPNHAAGILHSLFTKIWNNNTIPTTWSKGNIIKVTKKGDLIYCNNWRATPYYQYLVRFSAE
ncbi:uncharacterized protein LOC134228767 [Saccostrea cucullata]|uniref:uncharacterized protein LOC134228767 n=1 Tax=Saccostrea cuccullata TaxID=36930 RepID=UPI002ED5DC32